MEVLVCNDGSCRAIYGEMIDLTILGDVEISRASYVEPTENGMWLADLSPTGGPVLGPFHFRSEALTAEIAWLHKNLMGDY